MPGKYAAARAGVLQNIVLISGLRRSLCSKSELRHPLYDKNGAGLLSCSIFLFDEALRFLLALTTYD
jgi:hypothetical protein